MTEYARVENLWTGDSWVRDALIALDGSVRPATAAEAAQAEDAGLIAGTLLPPVTDCHVHLGLSDFADRGAGSLGRMLDLGWDVKSLAGIVEHGRRAWAATEVLVAGTFLTAVGGYPSTRPWAPPGSATEIADVAGARAAVAALGAVGAVVAKVALNSVAGPVLTDELLDAVVVAAHDHDLPVVAHVEGPGQAVRAWRAGVDAFAHTPWEQLSTDDIAEMAETMIWISTVDMHGRGHYGSDYGVAMENLTRFAAHGGRVAYGTDLGNGVERAGLLAREVRALGDAGLSGHRLLGALTGGGLLPRWGATANLLDLPDLQSYQLTPAGLIEVLAASRPVTAAQLARSL